MLIAWLFDKLGYVKKQAIKATPRVAPKVVTKTPKKTVKIPKATTCKPKPTKK